jgi:hypothetical protein
MFNIACALIILGIILTRKKSFLNESYGLLTQLIAGLNVIVSAIAYHSNNAVASIILMFCSAYLIGVFVVDMFHSHSRYKEWKTAFDAVDTEEWVRRSIEGDENDIFRQKFLDLDAERQADIKRIYDMQRLVEPKEVELTDADIIEEPSEKTDEYRP